MAQNCSKRATFLFSAYFGGHICPIATVKDKLISEFYNGEKQSLFLASYGGGGAKIARWPHNRRWSHLLAIYMDSINMSHFIDILINKVIMAYNDKMFNFQLKLSLLYSQ